MLVLITPGNT